MGEVFIRLRRTTCPEVGYSKNLDAVSWAPASGIHDIDLREWYYWIFNKLVNKHTSWSLDPVVKKKKIRGDLAHLLY